MEQKYSKADQYYKSALKVNPNSKEAIYNLANSSYKQGRLDEALKGYEKYVSMENKNLLNLSKAFHNMGNVYLRKHPAKDQNENYLEKAIEAYKQSLRINPNDEETRYNLAVAQKLQQNGNGGNKNQNQNKNKKDKQNQDKNKQDKNNQNKNKNQDQNQNKKDQQKQNNQQEMSQDNVNQILKAIEQDEKQTQERVKQIKIEQRKQKNDENRHNNKDW